MFDPYDHSSRAQTVSGKASLNKASARRSSSAQAASAGTAAQPATAKSRPWHKRPAWTRFARQLLRYYSRRGDFRLAIKPGQTSPLACVSPERRRVEVTTAFPKAGKNGPLAGGGVRGASRLRSRPTDTWLRGFIAHEAGHIRHSRAKPAARTLGWLWNALEDERMERLMAERYDELPAIFDAMGDVMLSLSDEEKRERREQRWAAEKRAAAGEAPAHSDVLNACLQWRWLHDHRPARRTGHLPLPASEFEKAQRLVEEAWDAPNSDEVTRIASEILEVFGIPEDAPVPDKVPGFDLPGGISAGGQLGSDADEGDTAQGDSDGGDSGEDADEPNAQGSHDLDPDAPEPEAPYHDPESAPSAAGARLLSGQEQAVQALAQALRPEAPHQLRRPHRSRGRFAYDRWASGQSRVFTRRPERPQPPASLTVLLDASSSMAYHSLFTPAQRCVALLSGAAEVAGASLRLIPFTTRPGRIAGSQDAGGHEALRERLAGYRADGYTTLHPALRAAFRETSSAAAAPHARHIVVLISDGQLEGRDPEQCRQLYQRARARQPGLLALPLLLGAAIKRAGSAGVDGAAVYERIFGRYAAVENPADLADIASRWLQHAA